MTPRAKAKAKVIIKFLIGYFIYMGLGVLACKLAP